MEICTQVSINDTKYEFVMLQCFDKATSIMSKNIGTGIINYVPLAKASERKV